MKKVICLLFIGMLVILATECLSQQKDRKIIISGEVILPGYKQGYIRCGFQNNPRTSDPDVIYDWIELSEPGPYRVCLVVPKEQKAIYMGGYNDSDDDGEPCQLWDPVTPPVDEEGNDLVRLELDPNKRIYRNVDIPIKTRKLSDDWFPPNPL